VIILVDYDNVRELDRNHGLVYVVERVVRTLGVTALENETRARVRLYGGWFQEQRLSRSAQRLAPQVQADFPRPIAVSDQSRSARVVANVEIATSLECDPSSVLLHTFRPRSPQTDLRCSVFPFGGCISPGSCCLASLNGLLSSGTCPIPGCGARVSDILYRSEQKLVDTMLVTDLIHFASRHKETLVVVSSDDDLWPGIHSAVVHGATLHHVQTISGRFTPPYYSKLISGSYLQHHM
jgi:uncharacterized LabA/DUF88 family protein